VPPRGRRPAGGPDTRAAIVASARELFARQGFERTTMRAVAARAGVDPALIHHYFGTKDGLLSAALTPPVSPHVLLAGLSEDRGRAGHEFVRRLLDVWEDHPVVQGQMLALIRTALSHEHATALLRETLQQTVVAAVREVAAPDRRELRAALVMSQMSGLLLSRYLVGLPGVADADRRSLVAAVGPVVQHYLTGRL
jgi:AcrR family transcriptional regulator